MRNVIVIAACILLLPGLAHGASHIYVPAGSSSQGIVFVDMLSIQKNANGTSAWVLAANFKPSPNVVGKPTARVMWFERVMCPSSFSRTESLVEYAEDGTVNSSSTSPSAAFEPIVPGSIGELISDVICNKTKMKGMGAFTSIEDAMAFAHQAPHDTQIKNQ